MKNTIETPTGCKIAKTEIIEGNLIVTYERDLPESVNDIDNRPWFINSVGIIMQTTNNKVNNFSNIERAEAVLALGQLLELAAYVGCKDFYCGFNFGIEKQDIRVEFEKKYAHLIEKTKKLL